MIVLSAAELLWEMFSVSLTSENQELIPIHSYEIRERRFCFLCLIIFRRARRCDSPGLRALSRSLYAANLVRSSYSNRSDGLLSELRKRPALRNDPIRAELRPNFSPHIRRTPHQNGFRDDVHLSFQPHPSFQHSTSLFLSHSSRIPFRNPPLLHTNHLRTHSSHVRLFTCRGNRTLPIDPPKHTLRSETLHPLSALYAFHSSRILIDRGESPRF